MDDNDDDGLLEEMEEEEMDCIAAITMSLLTNNDSNNTTNQQQSRSWGGSRVGRAGSLLANNFENSCCIREYDSGDSIFEKRRQNNYGGDGLMPPTEQTWMSTSASKTTTSQQQQTHKLFESIMSLSSLSSLSSNNNNNNNNTKINKRQRAARSLWTILMISLCCIFCFGTTVIMIMTTTTTTTNTTLANFNTNSILFNLSSFCGNWMMMDAQPAHSSQQQQQALSSSSSSSSSQPQQPPILQSSSLSSLLQSFQQSSRHRLSQPQPQPPVIQGLAITLSVNYKVDVHRNVTVSPSFDYVKPWYNSIQRLAQEQAKREQIQQQILQQQAQNHNHTTNHSNAHAYYQPPIFRLHGLIVETMFDEAFRRQYTTEYIHFYHMNAETHPSFVNVPNSSLRSINDQRFFILEWILNQTDPQQHNNHANGTLHLGGGGVGNNTNTHGEDDNVPEPKRILNLRDYQYVILSDGRDVEFLQNPVAFMYGADQSWSLSSQSLSSDDGSSSNNNNHHHKRAHLFVQEEFEPGFRQSRFSNQKWLECFPDRPHGHPWPKTELFNCGIIAGQMPKVREILKYMTDMFLAIDFTDYNNENDSSSSSSLEPQNQTQNKVKETTTTTTKAATNHLEDDHTPMDPNNAVVAAATTRTTAPPPNNNKSKNKKFRELNCDMAVFQRVVIEIYHKNVFSGYPFHTKFWKEDRAPGAFIKHK